MSKKVKQEAPANTKPGNSVMTKEQIQSEYAQTCTVIGDRQYKFELEKAKLNSRLLELNQMFLSQYPEDAKASQAAQVQS